jgi:cadmium resistance protein CadD (predicted permease)
MERGKELGVFVLTAVMAFVGTNVDDLLVLLVFFVEAEANATHGDGLRSGHVVGGQVLGFSILLLLSLLGLLLGLFLPPQYLGLFGLLPLLIGLYGLFTLVREKLSPHPGDETEGGGEAAAGMRDNHEADGGMCHGVEMRDTSHGVDHDADATAVVGKECVSSPPDGSAEWADVAVGTALTHHRTLTEAHQDVQNRRHVFHTSFHTHTHAPDEKGKGEGEGAGAGAGENVEHDDDDDEEEEEESLLTRGVGVLLSGCVNPHMLKVALVCVANGGDNIAVYMPYFASLAMWEVAVTLVVFYLLMVLWIALAYALIRLRVVAEFLSQWGELISPFLLIGLGLFILAHSGALSLIASWVQ